MPNNSLPPHPMQPVVMDGDVVRFRRNAIVCALLDAGPLNMNTLAAMDFPREDREQFAQLIGYSVSGYSELSYVSDASYARAAEAAAVLLRAGQGGEVLGDTPPDPPDPRTPGRRVADAVERLLTAWAGAPALPKAADRAAADLAAAVDAALEEITDA